jgi:chemotaxis protein methyltransferase CheR
VPPDLSLEFQPIAARDFERIRTLAYAKFGLNLTPAKQTLVSARIGKLLKEKGHNSFDEFWQGIESDRSGEALIGLINVLTTNFTSFLREPQHFEFLKSVIVPQFSSLSTFRVWSAACATGEEPYSIAFTLSALNPGRDTQILATDISTRALDHAKRGVYGSDQASALSPEWMRRFLLRGEGRSEGTFKVKPAVQQMIQYQRFNLLEDPLPRQKFAVIFCRNVMIYFDRPTKEKVVARLASVLEPGGYLFTGHSESLTGVAHPLAYVRPAIYRNAKGGTIG